MKPLSDGSYLVSLDVRSLYANIPHKEGIKAVKQKLKSKPSISTKVILTFLTLILTLNKFAFNGMNYLQKKGCTMGTKCARSYANIFMASFKEKLIFPFLTNSSDFYVCFIDNIFLNWNDTKTEFDDFSKKSYECYPSIKFEYEISKTEINFLDTTVFKVDN